MINNEYMDGSVCIDMDAVLNEYNSFMESCDNEMDFMLMDFNIMREKVMLESEIMGTVPEDLMIAYESEKKNIFTMIGEMIIKIYNKIVEIIEDAIDKIKELSFKRKPDIQKIQVYMKKNPKIADEVWNAYKAGALDIKDAKDLKEIDAAYDEILKLAKQQDIKPGTLRDTWEKTKKKLKNLDKPIGVAVATIGLAKAIKIFPSECAKATEEYNKHKTKVRKEKAELHERLKNQGVIDDSTGVFRTLLQIWREKNGMYMEKFGECKSCLDRMGDWFAKIADKYLDKNKTAAKRLHGNLDAENSDGKVGPTQTSLDID
jgi:hypothetical protein